MVAEAVDPTPVRLSHISASLDDLSAAGKMKAYTEPLLLFRTCVAVGDIGIAPTYPSLERRLNPAESRRNRTPVDS